MLITRVPRRLRLTGKTYNDQIRHVPDSRLAQSERDRHPQPHRPDMERGGLRWGVQLPKPIELRQRNRETPRLRGRAAVEQRRRRLMAEPLCRDCKARGKVTASTVPDHIVPLAHGGSDDDSNIRCLCQPCHEARTAEQFGYRRRQTIGVDGWPV